MRTLLALLLLVYRTSGPHTVRGLAGTLGVSKPVVTRALNTLGRLGYLKFQLFRANRCIADTGIHAMKWTREQAIRQFVDSEGEAPGFAAREVERYCVSPGQACSYKIGHTVWVNARERTKQALGAKYSIKDFHDAGLSIGRVPLDVLDGAINRYIATAKG